MSVEPSACTGSAEDVSQGCVHWQKHRLNGPISFQSFYVVPESRLATVALIHWLRVLSVDRCFDVLPESTRFKFKSGDVVVQNSGTRLAPGACGRASWRSPARRRQTGSKCRACHPGYDLSAPAINCLLQAWLTKSAPAVKSGGLKPMPLRVARFYRSTL